MGAPLHDAQAGSDVAQPHARVTGDPRYSSQPGSEPLRAQIEPSSCSPALLGWHAAVLHRIAVAGSGVPRGSRYVHPDASSTGPGLPRPAPAGRARPTATPIVHEIIPDYAQRSAGIP